MIGLRIILVIFMVITMDILVFPTMIVTIACLTGWFLYLVYIYGHKPVVALFLGGVFLVIGSIYLGVVVKLRLWRWVSQSKKVPFPPNIGEKEISLLNEAEVVTHTDLRPVGKIKAGGKVVDALSETGFIPRGTQVNVIEYVEGQYKVKKK